MPVGKRKEPRRRDFMPAGAGDNWDGVLSPWHESAGSLNQFSNCAKCFRSSSVPGPGVLPGSLSFLSVSQAGFSFSKYQNDDCKCSVPPVLVHSLSREAFFFLSQKNP